MLRAPHEHTVIETRRHGIVLVRAFVRSFLLSAGGIALVPLGAPWSAIGAAVAALAAVLALSAVWRWERTRVVLTDERLFVVHGTLRRHAAGVRLERLGTIELEQGILGRILGYGTIVAGELEIDFVPAPRELFAVVERVAA
jgi:uncharacterized membrane protein YdbT with pleckstrin-like domain